MKNHYVRFMVVALIVLVSLLLTACSSNAPAPSKIEPSKLEPIGDSELKRVILTEKAAERLNIQTVLVREEQVVRNQTFVGEVQVSPGESAMSGVTDSGGASGGSYWIRLELSEGEMDQIDSSLPALIKPLTAGGDEAGWTAMSGEIGPADNGDDDEDEDPGSESEVKYYILEGDEYDLVTGERVLAEVSLSVNGVRKVVPYAALLYDPNGENWVYVKAPDSLTFTRQSVTVDYIHDGQVYLTDGPPVGSEVVTVGGSELFGTETGVSK